MSKIAIIAGTGDLPKKIEEQLKAIGQAYELISLTSDSNFHVGQVGKILKHLRSIGAKKIVFCGAIKRPSIFKLKLDKVGKEWLSKLGYRVFLGDDSLLKGIKKLLLEEGFEVISPQSILGTLLTPPGILTKTQPNEQDMLDIARGVFVLNTMAKADVGQAVIVQEGVVIAIEAVEGTRNLILRSSDLKINTEGGVLVKLSKIGQDQDIDLPTIGIQTVKEAKQAKLRGIALGANSSQIISFEETIKAADEQGIFILGI